MPNEGKCEPMMNKLKENWQKFILWVAILVGIIWILSKCVERRAETWQCAHRTNRQNYSFALYKLWCTQNVWSCPLLLDKATQEKTERNSLTAQHRKRYRLWLLLFSLSPFSQSQLSSSTSRVCFTCGFRLTVPKRRRKEEERNYMLKNKSNCIAQNDLFDISLRSTTTHRKTTTALRSHILVLRQTFFFSYAISSFAVALFRFKWNFNPIR